MRRPLHVRDLIIVWIGMTAVALAWAVLGLAALWMIGEVWGWLIARGL